MVFAAAFSSVTVGVSLGLSWSATGARGLFGSGAVVVLGAAVDAAAVEVVAGVGGEVCAFSSDFFFLFFHASFHAGSGGGAAEPIGLGVEGGVVTASPPAAVVAAKNKSVDIEHTIQVRGMIIRMLLVVTRRAGHGLSFFAYARGGSIRA